MIFNRSISVLNIFQTSFAIVFLQIFIIHQIHAGNWDEIDDLDCSISNVLAVAGPCDDNGLFSITITFDVEDPGAEGFQIVGNGLNYGTFEYGSDAYTVGPVFGDGEVEFEFVIVDVIDESCSNFFELGPIDCSNPCELWDLNITEISCGEVSYSAFLNFNFSNVGDIGFDLFVDDVFNQFYSYNDLPVQFSTAITEEINITVCENDTNCCTSLSFNNPCFSTCTISDVIAEAWECDDGFFYVDIDFEVIDPQAATFAIFGNGENYGTFEYGANFYTIGPLLGDGTTIYEFIVQDTENLDCSDFTAFDLPIDCLPPSDVWPGDANFDNTANHFDFLNIGIAYGFEGEPRDNDNIMWDEMQANPWENSFEFEGVNFKHADCNGDGIINFSDTVPINLNYDLVHGDIITIPQPEGTLNDPPFFVDLPEEIILGVPFSADIILGSAAVPVEDLYGIAFTLNYNIEQVDESSVEFELTNGFIGETEVMNTQRSFSNLGQIEIAFTRINQVNISGNGSIATFTGIIDDIAGMSGTEIWINNIRAIDKDETPIPLYLPLKTTSLVSSTEIVLESGIELFPNPAKGRLTVRSTENEAWQKLRILNMLGQEIMCFHGASLETIDVAPLNSGVYFMEIKLQDCTILKKFEIVH